MKLFGEVISITGIIFQLFIVFAVILLGFLIGRIRIKGVSLGAAGVFIASLLFGAFFSTALHQNLTFHGEDITSNAFQIIENTGLILFVGAVGVSAGKTFFRNLKKNIKSYAAIAVLIILGGVLASLVCYFIGLGSTRVPAEEAALGITKNQYLISMIVGIMSGSMTSTPAFSAAQATAAGLVSPDAADALQDVVTTGHAIAYMFGVIGVVLFVQLIPRLLKADMQKEREKITVVDLGNEPVKDVNQKRFEIDNMGFAAFAFVVLVGIILGMIRIPLSAKGFSGITFSLTVTGGVLISGLVLGHFGHIGPVSLQVRKRVLEVFREFGLLLFLIGAGIPGGAAFVKYFHPIYFVFGVIITILPMVIGYFVAKKLFKLPLLNSLGSITGGMTATPALGALIQAAGTDEVASSYAAAYPIAMIAIVLASQFMILIFGA